MPRRDRPKPLRGGRRRGGNSIARPRGTKPKKKRIQQGFKRARKVLKRKRRRLR